MMVDKDIKAHTTSSSAPSFPRKWIIKGLSERTRIEDIQDELQSDHSIKASVAQMSRRAPHGEATDRVPAALFSVVADSSEEARKLREISLLCHHRITWEAPQKPDIRQCFRCQGFGISAGFCNYTRRCVKCDKVHGRDECANNSKDMEAYCVNCGVAGHPANWKGCPK